MSVYFENFPIIGYQGKNVRDITRRVAFLKETVSNPYVFLPYTIEDGIKPEDVAQYYYGSVDYTWIVLLANNIIDPYNQWPLSEENFHRYLIDKYASVSGKKGYEVVDWTRNETITDNILYYYREFFADSQFTEVFLTGQTISSVGEEVEIDVRVVAEKGVPAGDVEMFVDDKFFEMRNLINSETTFTLSNLSKDVHKIYVNYIGTTKHVGSVSEVFTHRVL